MIVLVGTILPLLFYAIGLRYRLLVGAFAGGFAVILAVPIAAVLVTLLDVIARDRDPAEEEVATVLFPAKEAES